MMSEYMHQTLGEDVHALAGYYTLLKEIRLDYNGREVLYIIGGSTAWPGSCAGGGYLAYAIVPGYLVAWKSKRSKEGLPVSEVTPILDEETKKQVAKIIQSNECISNVNFW